jgi:hypothetical protein
MTRLKAQLRPAENRTVYIKTLRYPHRKVAPLLGERAWTQEIEPPYRTGLALAVRIPFTVRAVVLGRWVSAATEEEVDELALRSRRLDVAPEELAEWD